jgi:hypothetical protein
MKTKEYYIKAIINIKCKNGLLFYYVSNEAAISKHFKYLHLLAYKSKYNKQC